MAHAILSASSAHRWSNCPVSVQNEGTDSSSEVAAEGTLAHRIADDFLRGKPWPLIGSTHEVDGYTFTLDSDFLDDVRSYTDYVQTRRWAGAFKPESEVNYSALLSVPYHTAWGTSDCCGWIELPSGERGLMVIDLKFGRRAVSPVGNAQGMMYAAGVLQEQRALNLTPRHTAVHIVIFQPRVSRKPQVWETTVGEVEDFVAQQREPAEAALHFYSRTDTPALRAKFPENPGAHCTYCKRIKSCQGVKAEALRAAQATPASFDSRLFELRTVIRDLLEQIEQQAFDAAVAGTPYPGTKLVSTRGGSPKLLQDEGAVKVKAHELNVRIEETKLLSPAKIRDIFKKAGVSAEELSSYISTPAKGLKIASLSDAGEPVQTDASAAFTGVQQII